MKYSTQNISRTENNKAWEIRTDKELHELYGEAIISNLVKTEILQWFGHLERMDEGTTPKVVAWAVGTRRKKKRRRPRKRWSKEAVVQNMEERQIKN